MSTLLAHSERMDSVGAWKEGPANIILKSMFPYTLHGTRSVTLHLVNSQTIRLSKRTKKRITQD
jgi:hypothetical protein